MELQQQDDKKWVIPFNQYVNGGTFNQLFTQVWNRPVPEAYVLDLEGVDILDYDALGIIVLLWKHANSKSAGFELRNSSHGGFKDLESLLNVKPAA